MQRKTSGSIRENHQQTLPTCDFNTRTGTQVTLVGGERAPHYATLAQGKILLLEKLINFYLTGTNCPSRSLFFIHLSLPAFFSSVDCS